MRARALTYCEEYALGSLVNRSSLGLPLDVALDSQGQAGMALRGGAGRRLGPEVEGRIGTVEQEAGVAHNHLHARMIHPQQQVVPLRVLWGDTPERVGCCTRGSCSMAEEPPRR